jgi:hypothetical protein
MSSYSSRVTGPKFMLSGIFELMKNQLGVTLCDS